MKIHKTLLAGAIALIATPLAFAQSTATDTASGKRFSVVGGAALLEPDSTPIDGTPLRIDGGGAPVLSGTFHFNDNWGVELWGALDGFSHRVRGDEGRIGNVKQQPVALSAQYHFGQADNVFRPFVGLGYYTSNFYDEDLNPGGEHVSLDSPHGAIGTVGVDFNINPTWFVRVDGRYMRSRADANLAGETIQRNVRLDPWTAGIGIGARF